MKCLSFKKLLKTENDFQGPEFHESSKPQESQVRILKGSNSETSKTHIYIYMYIYIYIHMYIYIYIQ